MKIVFICGSLEPGKDGVGDYVRQLAGQLIRQGHAVAAIAINDKHIVQVIDGLQQADDASIPVLRLPAVLGAAKRMQLAKKWNNAYKPDWISLQYVPYAFQRKGLPLYLVRGLLGFGEKYKWHFMLHELWIGKSKSISGNIISMLQTWVVKNMVRQIKPKVVNVSTPFYVRQLNDIGVKASVLKLFGNIPESAVNNNYIGIKEAAPYQIKLLYFGTAPRGQYQQQVIKGIAGLSSVMPGQVCLLIVSGDSESKNLFITSLTDQTTNSGLKIIDCGFLENTELSSVMKVCSAGIARSEPQILGKSGSAIAMLEHGLPVWMPKWDSTQPLEYDFRTDMVFANLHDAVNFPHKINYHSLVNDVTSEFIDQLSDF